MNAAATQDIQVLMARENKRTIDKMRATVAALPDPDLDCKSVDVFRAHKAVSVAQCEGTERVIGNQEYMLEKLLAAETPATTATAAPRRFKLYGHELTGYHVRDIGRILAMLLLLGLLLSVVKRLPSPETLARLTEAAHKLEKLDPIRRPPTALNP